MGDRADTDPDRGIGKKPRSLYRYTPLLPTNICVAEFSLYPKQKLIIILCHLQLAGGPVTQGLPPVYQLRFLNLPMISVL